MPLIEFLLRCAGPVSTARQMLRAAALCIVTLLAGLFGLVHAQDAAPPEPADLQPAAQGLLLPSGAKALALWPHIMVLTEQGNRPMAAQDLVNRPDLFRKPQTLRENLGPSEQAVWMRLETRLAPNAGRHWILNSGTALLDEVDVYLASEGQVLVHIRTGDTMPMIARPMPLRTLGVPLELEHGREYELLMRVRGGHALLVPMQLIEPKTLLAHESIVQLGQGLLAGIGLCLLMYSLLQWLGGRNGMYAYYALSLAATIGFSLALHGVTAQHLWPNDDWLMTNGSLMLGLICLSFCLLFSERALGMSLNTPRLAVVSRTLSAGCALVLVGFVSGHVPYGRTLLFFTCLSVMPMVLAVLAASKPALNGDMASRLMLVGWLFHGCGAFVLGLLMHGMLPFSNLALHAFQIGSHVQMVMWMVVLSVHTENERAAGRLAEEQRMQAELERAQMTSLALTDPLTGLANRRGMEQRGERILALASPRNVTAVMVMDLDSFKPINDSYGHEAGDEVLAGVAARLRRCLGDGNCVARLGGDEFVVVANHLYNEDEAHELAQRIRAAVTQPFFVRGHVCAVGITVGYALAPFDGKNLRELLECADAALYEGKRQGKARVCRWRKGLAQAKAKREVREDALT